MGSYNSLVFIFDLGLDITKGVRRLDLKNDGFLEVIVVVKILEVLAGHETLLTEKGDL